MTTIEDDARLDEIPAPLPHFVKKRDGKAFFKYALLLYCKIELASYSLHLISMAGIISKFSLTLHFTRSERNVTLSKMLTLWLDWPSNQIQLRFERISTGSTLRTWMLSMQGQCCRKITLHDLDTGWPFQETPIYQARCSISSGISRRENGWDFEC